MRKYHINLLRQEHKEPHFTEQLIYFALHYLRYVIILTQIIVIGVFFYRFSVDQKVIDLKESISQKQEIIRIAMPLVDEAKTIAAKSTVIKSLLEKQKLMRGHLEYIVSIIPQTVTITTLSLTASSIQLDGETADIVTIRTFYERLKKDGQFKTIVLNQIVKKEGIFRFTIAITI